MRTDLSSDLLSAETVIKQKDNTPTDLCLLKVEPAIRRQLTRFYGALARQIQVYVTSEQLPGLATAYCEGRSVVLNRSVLAGGRDNLISVLAHEFGHTIQQGDRCQQADGLISVLDNSVMEMEADRAATALLSGAGLPPLTVLAKSECDGRPVRQCQAHGRLTHHTLNEPRAWVPAALPPSPANPTYYYDSVNSRNEVWGNRAAALVRTKALAGVGREARRTYH